MLTKLKDILAEVKEEIATLEAELLAEAKESGFDNLDDYSSYRKSVVTREYNHLDDEARASLNQDIGSLKGQLRLVARLELEIQHYAKA